ncbi:hypothetical protein [Mangrovibacterium lignilyticum]|uniref:hypothetical protein n=1 Tax=Mangrovibacterium lignilyticum TaxID=2668052 RepID=UPI0013D8E01D|nr:hypothetical protein [Mangrovibacterium lignilyticum]
MTTSETGHEKNLSLYEQMIAELKTETADYNPPIDKLSMLNLEANVAPVAATLSAVRSCLADYTFAVNDRQTVYADMEKRVTRVNDLLPMLGVDALTIADMKTFYDKIKGYAANSTQGFEHLKEYFDSFLSMLKKISLYATNDPTLSTTALDTLSADLQVKNNATANTDAALNNARELRNQAMYNPQNGIVPLSKSVKQYYRSKEGVKGIMYKRLVALLKPMR